MTPTEIIADLFYEEDIVTLTAGMNLGKTPLLRDWAFCIATGTPWCGRAVAKRPVLLLGYESAGWKFDADWERLAVQKGVPTPTPANFEVYLERGNIHSASTIEIINTLTLKTKERVEWLRTKMLKYDRPVVIIDPFELFFRVDKKEATAIVEVYQFCRFVRGTLPGTTFIFSFNRRKRERGRGAIPPNLLKDPHGWLEEASGAMEIQSRSDVRLGLDFHGRQEDMVRVFNGVKREETLEPMFITPILVEGGSKPMYAGFEQVSAQSITHEDTLSPRQLTTWHELGETCTFTEIVEKSSSRTAAYRFRAKCLSAGLLREAEPGIFQKMVTMPEGEEE